MITISDVLKHDHIPNVNMNLKQIDSKLYTYTTSIIHPYKTVSH